ncbi:protein of unknown function [Hyphomicrobium sp. MC1]|nr:protein of unknown function [Hyphomicrobium sp. MC1]
MPIVADFWGGVLTRLAQPSVELRYAKMWRGSDRAKDAELERQNLLSDVQVAFS